MGRGELAGLGVELGGRRGKRGGSCSVLVCIDGPRSPGMVLPKYIKRQGMMRKAMAWHGRYCDNTVQNERFLHWYITYLANWGTPSYNTDG